VAASEAMGQEFLNVGDRILSAEIGYAAISLPAILEQYPVAFVRFHWPGENLLQRVVIASIIAESKLYERAVCHSIPKFGDELSDGFFHVDIEVSRIDAENAKER
jgi:hypothetical protein